MQQNELPIGIFDSGIGGLTVLRALRETLPQESMIYLGDTARLPYGTKSAETVCHYALNACDILVEQGIKCLVVACNTATAVALDAIQSTFPNIPVVGVIQPGAQSCLTVNNNGPIVVLATESTVKGRAYQKALTSLTPHCEVIEWPCQLLVALAEEGWCQGELVESIIKKILSPLAPQLEGKSSVSYLLGCTHFPVLKQALQNVLGQSTIIVDPAKKVAEHVFELLIKQNLLNQSTSLPYTRFLATDGTDRFSRVARIFLGEQIPVETVELVTFPYRSYQHTDKVLDSRTYQGKA